MCGAKAAGAGPLVCTDPTLLADPLSLLERGARGPMPLRWTCKSLRHLADEMGAMGHRISCTVIGELLRAQEFSLQGNSKTDEGVSHGGTAAGDLGGDGSRGFGRGTPVRRNRL